MDTSGSDAFDKWRDAVARDGQLRTEMMWLMESTVNTYNVSDRSIRFIVGSIGEWLAAFSAYAAGVLTLPEGHNADGHDLVGLLERNRELWSVKSSYTRNSTFRLTNGMGGAGAGFVHPTIFWSPVLPGIVYVDPHLHTDVAGKARNAKDAWVINQNAILAHSQDHPECVIPLTIPENPGNATVDPGFEAVKLLVLSGHFPRLSQMLTDTSTKPSTIVDQIRSLKGLVVDGTLSQTQFEMAVNRLVNGG